MRYFLWKSKMFVWDSLKIPTLNHGNRVMNSSATKSTFIAFHFTLESQWIWVVEEGHHPWGLSSFHGVDKTGLMSREKGKNAIHHHYALCMVREWAEISSMLAPVTRCKHCVGDSDVRFLSRGLKILRSVAHVTQMTASNSCGSFTDVSYTFSLFCIFICLVVEQTIREYGTLLSCSLFIYLFF